MGRPFADPVGAKIVQAFRDPGSSWRTSGGIARDSGLPAETVHSYLLEHRDYFVQPSLTLGGTQVYALREDLRAALNG